MLINWNHLKTAICIYSGYHCSILKFIWKSQTREFLLFRTNLQWVKTYSQKCLFFQSFQIFIFAFVQKKKPSEVSVIRVTLALICASSPRGYSEDEELRECEFYPPSWPFPQGKQPLSVNCRSCHNNSCCNLKAAPAFLLKYHNSH